jgi:glycosyltransferase involved in cell wall biosynthesis
MQHALLIGCLARNFSKRKPRLLAAIHTTINESLIGELSDRWLYSKILRKCDKILFVCQKQKAFWEERYPFIEKNSTVIYNGVDTAYFDPLNFIEIGRQLRNSLEIPEKATVVCCIASFRPEKSHDILIKAFSKLDSSCYLLLAGDGKKRHEIEQMAKLKKIENRVKFLGMLTDVRPVIAASDVSVLASTSVETFSMTMLESMSMNVPMIATDVGGLSEAIISDQTGSLVTPGDVHALSNGLQSILSDKDKLDTVKINCRKVVIEKFSEDAMIQNTERIISSLL